MPVRPRYEAGPRSGTCALGAARPGFHVGAPSGAIARLLVAEGLQQVLQLVAGEAAEPAAPRALERREA